MSTPAEVAAITGILKKIEAPVIVELGAYHGEDSAWMRQVAPSYHMNVLVEPDSRNFLHVLRSVQGCSRNTMPVMAAIANYTGMIAFHGGLNKDQPAGVSASGSIRNPTAHRELFPEITFPDNLVTRVQCFTLDDLMESVTEQIESVDLLWVDIQGAERDMIAGGQRTLKNTRYLFIEAEEQQFYEGQAVRPELLAMLPGWEVIGEFDYNLLLRNQNV